MRRADGQLALRVTVEGAPLAWAPPARARLELADGRLLEVAVEVDRSTAPGSYAAGVAVLLTLAVGDDVGVPVKVHLVSGGQVLELSL